MDDRAVYSDIPWKLKDKEKRLISFIRQLGHGELIIKVQDGLPVMIEKSTEKVKL